MILYHYTTIDAFLKIWVTQQLRFSNRRNTNDTLEKFSSFAFSLNYQQYSRKELDLLVSKVEKEIYSYQQISFTCNYSNNIDGCLSPMMWGQYAHNEEGVCIEINTNKLKELPDGLICNNVKYDGVPSFVFNLPVTASDAMISAYVKRNIKKFYFHKHKHWKPENEYRMVLKTNGEETYLNIENAITAVTVYRIGTKNEEIVSKAVAGTQVAVKALHHETNLHGNQSLSYVYVGQYKKAMDPNNKPRLSIPQGILRTK